MTSYLNIIKRTGIYFSMALLGSFAGALVDRWNRKLTMIGAVFSVLFSPVNSLFPLMSLDYFGGTTTHASIVEITFTGGMMIGGILLGI